MPSPRAKGSISDRKLCITVIGGGPAGSSAMESLAAAVHHLIDRHVSRIKFISSSNLAIDFRSKSLRPHESIHMLRHKVLDSFLRSRAKSNDAILIPSLVMRLEIPSTAGEPYLIHYFSDRSKETLIVDLVVGTNGTNSHVAKEIGIGDYAFASRWRSVPSKWKNVVAPYNAIPVTPYNVVALSQDQAAAGLFVTIKVDGCVRFKVGTFISGKHREMRAGSEIPKID